MSDVAQPVFLSYARRVSRSPTEALAERLGPETAFFDSQDIALGEAFPTVLRDAVLEARVVVVFATETYFDRPYCWKEWSLALAPWDTLLRRGAKAAALEAALAHLIIVLPESGPPPLDRLPPNLRRENLPNARDLDAVTAHVAARLEHVDCSIGERLDALGVREIVTAGLGGTDLLLPEGSLRGRCLLDPGATSLGDGFVGRAAELFQLDSLLRPGGGGGGVAAITGALIAGGGFGKSRLALEYVWRYQALRFPGGVFWLNADAGPDGLEPMWHAVLQALDPEVPELSEFSTQRRDVRAELDAALRRHHEGEEGPCLVVLDNVPEPRPGEPVASLDDLLPGRRWVTVLATSRRRLSEAHGNTLSVDVLDKGSARLLLLYGVGPHEGLSTTEWDEVTAWVGRLPLALELLNRGIAYEVFTADELLEQARGHSPTRVGERAHEVLQEHVPEGSLRGICEAFDLTFTRLPPKVLVVAQRAAWFGGASLPKAMVDGLCASAGVDSSRVRAWLVSRSVWGRAPTSAAAVWSMHRLIADYLQVTSPAPLTEWRSAIGSLNGLAAEGAATRAEERQQLLAVVDAALEAAASAPKGVGPDDGRLLGQVASWLEDLGKASGVLSPLVAAQQLLEGSVLPLFPREEAPLDWSWAQNKLGTVHSALGEGRGDEGVLEASISAHRSALEVLTRASTPVDWAQTQHNLGSVLQILGERRGDDGLLEASVRAYRSALEVRTRETSPVDWATTQNNLGNVFQILGGLRGDEAMLEASVEAYRTALQVRTRQAAPADWGKTKHNLGIVLRVLGARRGDEEMLETAVAAFRSALQVRTCETSPADWAMTQNSLGTVLWTLGERRGDEVLLGASAEAYRAALEVRTREAAPMSWAMTQHNVGNVLRAIGEHRIANGKEALEDLEASVEACRAALEVFTRASAPVSWAATQCSLGNALRVLGEHRGDGALLEASVGAYHSSLEVHTRVSAPVGWATTQINLGLALRGLGERQGDRELLKASAEAHRLALEAFREAGHSVHAQMAQRNLDSVRRLLQESPP
ncbi:MAG: toll/interleukin-1 receptor domain-containing protein [Myxococcales bacterium]|nr:toll/interleukin-1 receptor domain-containing protein [Myxococcales bacterium]